MVFFAGLTGGKNTARVDIWIVWARLVLGGAASTFLTAAFNDKGLLGKVIIKVMQLMMSLALGFSYVGFHAYVRCNRVSWGWARLAPLVWATAKISYEENTVYPLLHCCFSLRLFCNGLNSIWMDTFFGRYIFLAVLFRFQRCQRSVRPIIVQVYDPMTGFAKYAGHLQHLFISLDVVFAQEQRHLHQEDSMVTQSGWGTSLASIRACFAAIAIRASWSRFNWLIGTLILKKQIMKSDWSPMPCWSLSPGKLETHVDELTLQ